MKAKQLTYLLFVMTFIVGCNRYWVRTETSDQIIWKKKYTKTNHNGLKTIPDNCFLNSGKITGIGNFHEYNFYEFDTIRIYFHKTDTNLNKLIKKGLVQGHYFFSYNPKDSCQSTAWRNPIKSNHNNWFGYNIYLTGFREIRTVKFPKKIKDKISLYKVFQVSFDYVGQPFINSEIFKFELTNKDYKCKQDTISLDIFIEKAKTTKIYQNRFEI